MRTKQADNLATMPNDYTNRRENLRKLIEQWGGSSTLATKLGYSNASFLVQMADRLHHVLQCQRPDVLPIARLFLK